MSKPENTESKHIISKNMFYKFILLLKIYEFYLGILYCYCPCMEIHPLHLTHPSIFFILFYLLSYCIQQNKTKPFFQQGTTIKGKAKTKAFGWHFSTYRKLQRKISINYFISIISCTGNISNVFSFPQQHLALIKNLKSEETWTKPGL